MKKQTRATVKKYWPFGLALVLILIVAGMVIGATLINSDKALKADSSINTFEECAAAGYPIQESYPEVCSVPGVGSFTGPTQ